jgi:hypothetical protein
MALVLWIVIGGTFCNAQSGGPGRPSNANQSTDNDNEGDNSNDNNANENQSGDEDGTLPPASSEANARAIAAAVREAEQRIAEDASATDVLAAMVAVLEADENVAGAGVDSAGEPILWVDFINGETQIVQIIDRSTDADEGSVADLEEIDVPSALSRVLEGKPGARPLQKATADPRQQAIPSEPWCRLPGNDRALVANALAEFHGDWDINDVTGPIEDMLDARGYIVDPGPLTVDLFESTPDIPGQPHKVTLTDYSVVLLEAHNTVREPEYPAEMIQLPPELGIPNTGTCGGPGSRMVILTSSVADPQTIVERAADIGCGRLTLWKVLLVDADKSVRKSTHFGVTPNFIREHNANPFPDNTLFILNGCRGFWPYPDSPWKDMLLEKSQRGAVFMGWTHKPRYPEAARALLYLFQFLTASNAEVEVQGARVIRSVTPPRGGFDTGLHAGAYHELAQKGLNVYPKTGAVLERAIQGTDLFELILMPHPLCWERRNEEDPVIDLFAGAGPMVAIGGTAVSLTPISVYAGLWSVSAQPIVFGDLTVVEDNRLSIPRVVHRWRPQIKVESTGGSGPQITATLTLHARSTLDSNSFRESVWDPAPPATFDTVWDPEACSIGWQVSGQYTDGCETTVYSGNGLEMFDPSEHNNGFLRAVADGSGVHVEFDVTAPIRYTATTTNTCENTTFTSEVTESINVWKDDVPLSSNWTIGAASYTTGNYWPRQISWNAVAAEPPFDPDAEPR